MHHLNLDPDFNIEYGGRGLKYETFAFPAGESHIKITETVDLVTNVTIIHRLNGAKQIIELLLATDAVRRRYKRPGQEVKVDVFLPYIPYGRQDRAMVKGEPFSLKVFADLINSQNYDRVMTLEPHSDVTGALINNLETIHPNYLLLAQREIVKDFGEFTLVAPDGGALKRIYKHAQIMGRKGAILCATKVRDVSNGKILRTTIDATDEQIKGKVCVIDDDIASYSNTFMRLAEVLRSRGAKAVVLLVSHYEGVADEAKLKESGINRVFTTNSIKNLDSQYVKQYSV